MMSGGSSWSPPASAAPSSMPSCVNQPPNPLRPWTWIAFEIPWCPAAPTYVLPNYATRVLSWLDKCLPRVICARRFPEARLGRSASARGWI
jgi:hypothetical protein